MILKNVVITVQNSIFTKLRLLYEMILVRPLIFRLDKVKRLMICVGQACQTQSHQGPKLKTYLTPRAERTKLDQTFRDTKHELEQAAKQHQIFDVFDYF